MLFTTILFGIFTSSLERMLWQLFDWFIEILKPIVSILLLFVGVFRGIPLLVSFIESIIEDIRAEKEYTEVWERLDRVPTLQIVSSGKTPTEPKEEPKTDQTTQSRGEEITVHIPTQNGGKYLYVIKDSLEHKQALALARSETDRLRELEQSDHEANLKNIFSSKKGCKVE
jgi:hypothetical protein